MKNIEYLLSAVGTAFAGAKLFRSCEFLKDLKENEREKLGREYEREFGVRPPEYFSIKEMKQQIDNQKGIRNASLRKNFEKW